MTLTLCAHRYTHAQLEGLGGFGGGSEAGEAHPNLGNGCGANLVAVWLPCDVLWQQVCNPAVATGAVRALHKARAEERIQ
jgi:hypothetical protein